MARLKNLVGKVFGNLIVLSHVRKKEKSGLFLWYSVCSCTCGVIKEVPNGSLVSGATTSCGCMRYKKGKESKNFKDLTGKRIGKFIFCEPILNEKGGATSTWKCFCDCGKYFNISSNQIKRGFLQSCGCSSIDPKTKRLEGQRFTYLTVLEISSWSVRGKMVCWVCLCDCGQKTIVSTQDLLTKNVKSCGCSKMRLHRESVLIKDRREYLIRCRYSDLRNRHKKIVGTAEGFLTFEEYKLLIFSPCFYCNSQHDNEKTCNIEKDRIKNSKKSGKKGFETDIVVKHNGIDRVDSSKGYSSDNCRPACYYCNIAKTDQVEADFYLWVDRIYHNLIDKNLIIKR